MTPIERKRRQIKVMFLLLASTVLIAPTICLGANKWYDLKQLGRILVDFDSATVKTGDQMVLNLKGGENGPGYSHFSIVKPPTVVFNMDPALADSKNTTNSPTIDAISTLAPTMFSNMFTFSATTEQFYNRHLKLPDYVADTGPVTISFFWTESTGETAKNVQWKCQSLCVGDEATINASPTFQEVLSPTSNSSTTLHQDNIVTTLSALGWSAGKLLFLQIGRDAAQVSDTAAAANLHSVSIEVPITTMRESGAP